MSKIQEAWEEYEQSDTFETVDIDFSEVRREIQKMIDLRDQDFEAGYKAGRNSMKCCGTCYYWTWIELTQIPSRYTCCSEESKYSGEGVDTDNKCDKWEARE